MTQRAFYTDRDAGDGAHRYLSQPCTAGPWRPDSQHGSPPAALLTREVERLDTGHDRVVARMTTELLGPVPVGPVSVTASVVRPGRSVEMCVATLVDEAAGRAVATGTAWRLPAGPRPGAGAGTAETEPGHTPADGRHQDWPASWSGGYLDAVEWRWVSGAVVDPGPATVWMRPHVDLVEGEPISPVQRLMACVDSASGISAQLDPAQWGFLNTELTVHLVRPPEGEWVCVDARTTLGPGRAAMATADLYDEHGLVGRSAQTLLVTPR